MARVGLTMGLIGPDVMLVLQGEAEEESNAVKPLNPHEGCRVLLTGPCGHKQQRTLQICNTGDTVIFFHWAPVLRDNALGRREDNTKRFFVDLRPGTCAIWLTPTCLCSDTIVL